MKQINNREMEFNADDIFAKRWSPRAMSGESMSHEELMILFEAARWAPSSGNAQEWRFIFGLQDTPEFETLFTLLVEGNQVWCKDASCLMVVLSQKVSDEGRDLPTHSFDAGAAWQNLALQGSLSGLVIHGMAGFDYDKAKNELGVPDTFNVEAMIAVGKPGKMERLPEKLQGRESPSTRKKVNEFVFKGKFGNGF